jgi:acyl-ACP thioesterase
MKVDKLTLGYHVKSYECDHNGTLRLLTLMNIFQDAADSHASNLGVGIEHCLENGLAWFGSKYHIKIGRMPKWHEKIEVITWPSNKSKMVATRDFLIKDEEGNTIITASSQWVLINFERKHPVSLEDNLPPYNVILERSLESGFAKIPDLKKVDYTAEFKVRYDDIDVNNHVNNAVYPLWATESVDSDFRFNNIPAEIEITFKKEGFYSEVIEVSTQISEKTSLHNIKAITDGRELAKIKIKWK